jgi:CTP:molybdopterin cytidylyltransferase MocA/alpha-beta hydrolase superfamily lysophospholipase
LIAAVILAAGGSTRFGSPKQLAEFRGENMVRRAVRSARDAGIKQTIVVAGDQAHAIEQHTSGIDGARVVVNENWKNGQASSLRRGIETAISLRADAVLIMLADQPLVDAGCIRKLINGFDDGHQVIASEHSGTIGAPAIFSAKYFGDLLLLTGDEGAGKWLRANRDKVATIEVPEAATDVDTPADLPKHGSARERFLAFRRKQKKSPPLTQQTVKARGLDFAIFQSPPVAKAIPLLCINGGLHFGHEVLWPALAPLAEQRQLIFFDQRGRGKSQQPPGARGARIEHDALDVPAIRRALEIEKWNVLGHSWGGGIAMLATSEDQQGVNRLVLVDAVGPASDWLSRLHSSAVARLTGEKQEHLARLDPNALHVDDIDKHGEYASALYPAWFADRDFGAIFSSPRANSAIGAAVAARLRREGYDWRDRIASIRAPTLIIHGEEDLLDVSVPESIGKLIPDSQVSLIPHAGHMPFWEAPADFFSRVNLFLGEG